MKPVSFVERIYQIAETAEKIHWHLLVYEGHFRQQTGKTDHLERAVNYGADIARIVTTLSPEELCAVAHSTTGLWTIRNQLSAHLGETGRYRLATLEKAVQLLEAAQLAVTGVESRMFDLSMTESEIAG